MKPHVSIAGAGAAVTRITGDQAQDVFGEGLVIGADGTMLRDVTVTNRGDAGGNFHYVMVVPGATAMRIEDAVVEVHTVGAPRLPARRSRRVLRRRAQQPARDRQPRRRAVAFYVIEGSASASAAPSWWQGVSGRRAR